MLQCESLEARLQMAVDVSVNGEGYLEVIGDSADDRVVIEERGENNTEKWVYVRGKLVGGAPFIATQGVIVDLGEGNDSLTIRSGKGGYNNATIGYDIQLGDGDNTFTFEMRNVVDSELYFQSIASGAGDDRMSFKIGIVKDSRITLDGSEAQVALGHGDDHFALAWKSLENSSLGFTSGEDTLGVFLGEGNDTATVTRGDNIASTVWFGVDLGGVWEDSDYDVGYTNTVKIAGKSTVSEGGSSRYGVYGGAGDDKVWYDDERILGADSTVEVALILGAGDDVANVTMDGLRKRETGIGNDAGDYSYFALHVELGAGDDVFKQTFSPTYWRLQNGVTMEQSVNAGEGDDVISMTPTSKSRTLNLDGTFVATLEGGEGRDTITASLLNVLRIGLGDFVLAVFGDGSEGVGEGIADHSDVIKVNVSFVAASKNSHEAQTEYSAFIDVLGQEGDDTVNVAMRNRSLNLGVLLRMDGEDEGDLYTTAFDGLYDFEGLGGNG